MMRMIGMIGMPGLEKLSCWTSAFVTVYFPYESRYFEGGGQYDDKIF